MDRSLFEIICRSMQYFRFGWDRCKDYADSFWRGRLWCSTTGIMVHLIEDIPTEGDLFGVPICLVSYPRATALQLFFERQKLRTQCTSSIYDLSRSPPAIVLTTSWPCSINYIPFSSNVSFYLQPIQWRCILNQPWGAICGSHFITATHKNCGNHPSRGTGLRCACTIQSNINGGSTSRWAYHV